MLGGVIAIVGILIFGPSTHQSASFVFSHRINNQWILGTLLLVHDLAARLLAHHVHVHRLRRLCALSEETHDAERAAPRGLWTSIAYSAVGGWALLLGLTFAATHLAAINAGGGGAIPIIESSLSTSLAKLVLDISTIGQLFCGMGCVAAASRMVFAFSRDGAVPGHALWRKLNKHRTPTWAVLFVVVLSLIITIPALFGNKAGSRWPSSRSPRSRRSGSISLTSCRSSSAGEWVTSSSPGCGTWASITNGSTHRHGLGRDLRGHFLSADGTRGGSVGQRLQLG